MNGCGKLSKLDLFFLVLIAVVIIASNYTQIFAECIINNDYNYATFHSKSFQEVLCHLSKRVIPFSIIINNLIMAYIFPFSATLARIAVTLIGMIPVSILFYVIYRKILKLSTVPSFVAATLPNIIPGQALIPIFINGSYQVYALIPSLLFFIFSYRYVKLSHKNIGIFFPLTLFTASLFSTEISIFIAMPVFIFLGINLRADRRPKYLLLLSSCVIAALARFLVYSLQPDKGVAYRISPSGDFLRRSIKCLNSFSLIKTYVPHYDVLGWAILLVILSILLTKLTLKIFLRRYSSPGKSKINWNNAMFFAAVWMLFGAIPFIFLSSHPFISRYGYISAFGFFLLVVATPLSVARRKSLRIIIESTLIMALLMAGMFKNAHSRQSFGRVERIGNSIIEELDDLSFPPNSQIGIMGKHLGSKLMTQSTLDWSTGFLNYHLKRTDLSGIIGDERSFYDPFGSVSSRNWSSRNKWMCGLKKDRPTFVFKYDARAKVLKRCQYILSWQNDESWVIFKIDPLGANLSRYASGKGKAEYRRVAASIAKKTWNLGLIFGGGNR